MLITIGAEHFGEVETLTLEPWSRSDLTRIIKGRMNKVKLAYDPRAIDELVAAHQNGGLCALGIERSTDDKAAGVDVVTVLRTLVVAINMIQLRIYDGSPSAEQLLDVETVAEAIHSEQIYGTSPKQMMVRNLPWKQLLTLNVLMHFEPKSATADNVFKYFDAIAKQSETRLFHNANEVKICLHGLVASGFCNAVQL